MSSQLWEVMVKLEETRAEESLTCPECFAVIELLAEGASLGVEYEQLAALAREHLSQCSDCREALLAQLERLENMEK
jgi:predicted anti-sigma-YlaC factor YlaD